MPQAEEASLFQTLAVESCRSSIRLQILLLSILVVQIFSTMFDPTPLNLSVLFFQFSLFSVGYLGAKRMSARMLAAYVFLRSMVFLANTVLLVVYIIAPDHCGILQELTTANPPTEVFAAHINTLSGSSVRVWAFIAYTFVNMIYTTLIVMSMLLAWRLQIVIQATHTVLPLEVARLSHGQVHEAHEAPEKSLPTPGPNGYAPVPKEVVVEYEAPAVPQVPFVPEGAYPPQAFMLYPVIAPSSQTE